MRDLRQCSILSILLLIVETASTWAIAKDVFVDPQLGRASNNGSRHSPYDSLQSVIENGLFNPGDSILLKSGFYGPLTISKHHNKRPVTIAAAPGHEPRLSHIRILDSSNWKLTQLSISPSYSSSFRRHAAMVHIGPNVINLTVEHSLIQTVNSIKYWTKTDWNEKSTTGLLIEGSHIYVNGNTIRNIKHGLHAHAPHSVFTNNTIENFSGDGIRSLGDYTRIESNTIKNCFQVDNNHADAIQSWSGGRFGQAVGSTQIMGVILRGNKIINYNYPKQRLNCNLQGIGLYDGTFVDWVIENNLVVVNHWHGITVMGAINVRIVNNTVFDQTQDQIGPPWITITKHKNGTPSRKNYIANNLAQSFNLSGFGNGKYPTDLSSTIFAKNMIVHDSNNFFVNAAKYDFRLKTRSPAVDAGNRKHAPLLDITGNPRPKGNGFDIGAFELPQ